LAFALLIVTSLGATGLVLVSLRSIEQATTDDRRSNEIADSLDALMAALVAQQNAVRGFAISVTPNFLKDYEQRQADYDAVVARFRALQTDPVQRGRLDAVDATAKEWRAQSAERQIALAKDPDTRPQLVQFVSGRYFGKIREGLAEIRAALEAEGRARKAAQDRASRVAALVLLGGGLLSVALALASGWFLSRAITRPVSGMTAAMRRLAEQDLAVEVPGVGRGDEVGAMAGAVQVFKDNALRAREMEREQAEAQARRAAEDERVRREAEDAAAAGAAALVVGSIGAGLEKLAEGDLTHRLDTPLPEAYEPLRTNLNRAVAQLQELVRGIVSNTQAIRSGTGEVAWASDDLSRRTEQQAASLEETATALDQITATVKRTAEGAKQAREAAARTRADAERSGGVVRQAVASMGEIERSSQQIGQIIGVIDEIAFQTNLLALNAGVEAARAGEAGRGFAVVASEVRALAQRSAEAAKEIKTLISASAQQVGTGVKLVGETGQVLDRIVAQVGEVDGAVAEIAGSASEQATGLAEVNTAVNQMDQVTQQNAAMVEESTAAARALAQETERLAQLAARFRVGGRDAEAAPAPDVAPARRPAAAEVRPRPLAKPKLEPEVAARAARKSAPPADKEGWEEF
jgi:methyl-accepting chemotaxis protein